MKVHKDLKEWCRQMRATELTEADTLLVKAVEDAVSQAGMVPALLTKTRELEKKIADLEDDIEIGCRERDALRVRLLHLGVSS